MKFHRHLLEATEEILSHIFYEDRHADKVLEYFFRHNRKWGKRDRQFVAETVFDSVRWWRTYWWALEQQPHPDKMPFVVGVSLCARGFEPPPFAPYEDMDFSALQTRLQSCTEPSVAQSFPDWLYDEALSQLGPCWHGIAEALNQVNSIVLRTNTLAIDRPGLLEKLAEEEVLAKPLMHTENGILLEERANVFRTESFKAGLFEVQDGSSQGVAPFLQVEPGQLVIDACAGAGGKALHIGSLLKGKGRVLAMDIHKWKLDQLKLRARRNRIFNVETRWIENRKAIKRLRGKADRLLLDVPCSGLGVVRRNPDTKWKLTRERILELQDIQKSLLADYSGMVKPGGIMVYATCSVLPSENEHQVQSFLQEHPQWTLESQKFVFPMEKGFDGFYMARLLKASQ